jgi:copper chaperone CopZ
VYLCIINTLQEMTHHYSISGMTCEGCKAKVTYLLQQVPGVNSVSIDLEKAEASISMDHHIATGTFQDALKAYPKYRLSEKQNTVLTEIEEEQRGWFQTYKPVLLIFAFITGITTLIQFTTGIFNWMQWMEHFMAGFFIVFSFFKFLNLKGFAESYAMYDIIAKRWNAYGYVYAYIELGLGLSYLTGIFPVLINSITLVVMSISLIGVLKSVLNKQKIKCACLGDVFNLPMSTITIIEDALMILMSFITVISLLTS